MYERLLKIVNGVRWELPVLLIAAELIWAVLLLANLDGRQLLVFGNPLNWFSDFILVKTQSCATAEELLKYEACNRSTSQLFFALFRPFPNSAAGAIAQLSILSAALWAAILAFGRKCGLSWWRSAAFFLVMPFLFNVERANTIPLSAASVLFFLAFYQSKTTALRYFALAALSFAMFLKVSPAAFSFLLLLDRRFKDFALVCVGAAACMFMPYVFSDDFIGGVTSWLTACSQNGQVLNGPWGASFVARCVADVCGLADASWWHIVTKTCRFADIALSGALLWMVAVRKSTYLRVFGLAAIMLLLPPNAMHYTGLYLIAPAILFCVCADSLSPFLRRASTFLWLFVFSPVQLWSQPCGMRPIANLALLGLVALTLINQKRNYGN